MVGLCFFIAHTASHWVTLIEHGQQFTVQGQGILCCFLEVTLKLLWSTSIWIGYGLEITKVENVMHGICELYRPIKKFLTPNWCTFLHLCSSYFGTMLCESLRCLLSLDFVGFTAIKQGKAFDRFPLINLRVCVRRFKWEVLSVMFVGFFQKCKQGYFPWYNIGVNSDGAKAKDKVSRQSPKICLRQGVKAKSKAGDKTK